MQPRWRLKRACSVGAASADVVIQEQSGPDKVVCSAGTRSRAVGEVGAAGEIGTVRAVVPPVRSGRIAPEELEVVESPVLLVKQVDNNIDEVDDDPAALFEAGLAEDGESAHFTQVGNFSADRADLLIAGAGAYDKVLGDGREFGQLQDNNVAAVPIFGKLGGLAGQFATGEQVGVEVDFYGWIFCFLFQVSLSSMTVR